MNTEMTTLAYPKKMTMSFAITKRTKINIHNIFSFLILTSLHQKIRCDESNITEQKKIATTPRHKNNFSETPNAITTAITVADGKFDDNELKKLFVKNFKLYEKLERDRSNGTREIRQIISRNTLNGTGNGGLECLFCLANGTSSADAVCYKGFGAPLRKCSDSEQCYTELHPLYIKRGCMLPGSLNRTFVCKCPLCNDKPSYDSTYYEYTKLSDWEYDNERLQKPMMAIDLICKVCETRGVNKVTDNICKLGQNSDYMVCAQNQYCFTNIDDHFDYVSRGCITRPVYNTIHYLCNKPMCNSFSYPNPIVKREDEMLLRRTTPLASKLVSKSESINHGFITIFISHIMMTFT